MSILRPPLPAPGADPAATPDEAEVYPSLREVISPGVLTYVPLAAALLLWAIALPAIDPDRMTDLGLVSVLPPAFVAALAALILGFCLALAREDGKGWAPAAYVAAWVLVIHGTPAIVYGTLRYAWAWKHVGIVDYIQRNGHIDPTIDSLPVYHNWPGFFGAAALLTESAGLPDALALATWAPVAFGLLFAAGVLLILRSATPDPRLAWLGVWFFTLTNWVGQDYFAPQALAFALYLAAIGLVLWAVPLRTAYTASWPGRRLARWRPLGRLLAQIDRRISQAQAAGTSLPPLTVGQQRGLLAIVLLLLATIAVSHQLTPIVAILSLAALVVFGQCRARGLPLIMGIFTAAWLVTGAAGFAAEGLREIVASLGHADQNFGNNLIDPSLFTPGLRIVSNMARGLTAVVGVLAVLGWLRRLWQGYLDPALTLLWLAPVGLLAVSSYGGEILFRIFFFALPFMAFFVAALFAPRTGVAAVASWRAMLPIAVVSGLLTTGFLFAYYGHEQSNYFRAGEVAASDWLADHAPAGALVVEGSPNYPSRNRRYEELVSVPLVAWPRGNVEASVNAYTLEEIEEMMADRRYPATYLIITRGQLLALSIPGLDSIQTIERQMTESGDFTILYQNEDAVIYGLAARGAGA